MLFLARAFYKNECSLEKMFSLTAIDKWFLYRMYNIIETYKKLEKHNVDCFFYD